MVLTMGFAYAKLKRFHRGPSVIELYVVLARVHHPTLGGILVSHCVPGQTPSVHRNSERDGGGWPQNLSHCSL